MPNNYTFWKLINEYRLEIPIIQRDFAMGRDNTKAADIRNSFIGQIKNVLVDQSPNKKLHLNFVYGKIHGKTNPKIIENNKNALSKMLQAVKSYSESLDLSISYTVEEQKKSSNIPNTSFIPLDGQQRLTTLFLIHWYFLEKLKYDKTPLLNFSYRIRPAAKYFCEALVNNTLIPPENDEKLLSEAITDAQWFFNFWKKDPSVKGMLKMLDEIHKQFRNYHEDSVKDFWSQITENEKVIFEFLDLDKLELTDELYIKMNARGKPLTEYENFKAWLMNFVTEEKIKIEIHDWKKLMDTEWSDLFWANKDEENYLIDEEFMRFFRNMAQIYYVKDNEFPAHDNKEKRENVRILATHKGSDGEYLFIPSSYFKVLEVFNQRNLNNLFRILNDLSAKKQRIDFFAKTSPVLEGITFFDKQTDNTPRQIFSRFITGNMTYPDKVRFYALASFLLETGNKFSESVFFSYMRVCRNLINNTVIDEIDNFKRAINGVDKLLKEIVLNANCKADFYQFLSENKGLAGFSTTQLIEEQEKAALIVQESSWENVLIKYENHIYFKGQIQFLLELSRMKDGHKIHISTLKDYGQKCATIFSNLDIDENLTFQRALLCQKEDYLISVNSNYSFVRMTTPSGKRAQDWRSAFLKKTAKLEILRELLDDIDATKPIQDELKRIIRVNKNHISDYRKMFINFPEAIKYCEQRFIRYIDENQIRLLKSSATSHYHSELYPFCFFIELNNEDNKKKIEPFQNIEHYEVRSIDEYPCAALENFQFNKKDYSLHLYVDYPNDERHNKPFQVRFFCPDATNFKNYSPIIKKTLEDDFQFFKETDDYWYGFWKVKDTYEEAKELIIDLCKALNKLQP